MIDKKILNDLVCPLGKAKLDFDGEYIICTRCGTKYPVVEGIPVLMIDEAVLPEGISSVGELECMNI